MAAAGLSLVLASAPAAAQAPAPATNSDTTAAAEDLFQRAKRMLQSGNVASACPLFAESYRLDPAGGTLQNLAACLETDGKWASAYARFQELRALSKNASPPRTDRVKLAEEHLATLEPRVSRLVVTVPAGLADRTVVQVDGVTYMRAAWSTGVAIDPGAHDVVVTAQGKKPYRATATATKDGAEQTLRVPDLEDEEKPAPTAALSPSLPPPKEHPTRTAGFVVGGVGLAALGAGVAFGVLAAAKNSDGKDLCTRSGNPNAPAGDFDPATGRCYTNSSAWRDANGAKDDARTFATVTNVLLPVALVGLGVGTYLVLHKGSESDGRKDGAAVGLSLTPAHVSLDGSF